MNFIEHEHFPVSFKRLGAYLLLAVVAVGLPLFLWRSGWPVIRNSYGEAQELFELFGFTTSGALIAVAVLEFGRKRTIPFFLFLLVSFHFLTLVVEYSSRSWDYNCYQSAAAAFERGDNPYVDTVDQCYLYPPLPAQVLAAAYRLVGQVADGVDVWYVVFYLYQCGQYAAVLLCFGLCYRFGRILGLSSTHAALLITALFLANNPLVRTLRHNQINIWMLNLILSAIMLLPTRPIIAGMLVAVGGHIKLFSLALVPIWLLAKRWRALAAVMFGLMAILLTQISLGRGFVLWRQFIDFYTSQPLLRTHFRNNSLQNLIHNLLQMTRILREAGATAFRPIVSALSAALILALFILLIIRFARREKIYTRPNQKRLRLIGHSLDALALVLIVSPISWEHHYILTLPLLIWAVAGRGHDVPLQIGLSALLMLAVPTFDVFPFSFHRLLGLFIWLYLTAPGAIARAELRTLDRVQSPVDPCHRW